jgi:hypothetical protein
MVMTFAGMFSCCISKYSLPTLKEKQAIPAAHKPSTKGIVKM